MNLNELEQSVNAVFLFVYAITDSLYGLEAYSYHFFQHHTFCAAIDAIYCLIHYVEQYILQK